MSTQAEVFQKMKDFVEFGDQDVENLKRLAPTFQRHGQAITDQFYDTLTRYPETQKLIDGRVDALKATHARWMGELFAGNYGEDYFNNRLVIGKVHVRVKLDPFFVEAVMSFLRGAGLLAIREDFTDPAEAAELTSSYLKILDLDLVVINLAYADERLARLTKFTGMSRKLLERCITMG